jgi:hypothetical protein
MHGGDDGKLLTAGCLRSVFEVGLALNERSNTRRIRQYIDKVGGLIVNIMTDQRLFWSWQTVLVGGRRAGVGQMVTWAPGRVALVTSLQGASTRLSTVPVAGGSGHQVLAQDARRQEAARLTVLSYFGGSPWPSPSRRARLQRPVPPGRGACRRPPSPRGVRRSRG